MHTVMLSSTTNNCVSKVGYLECVNAFQCNLSIKFKAAGAEKWKALFGIVMKIILIWHSDSPVKSEKVLQLNVESVHDISSSCFNHTI